MNPASFLGNAIGGTAAKLLDGLNPLVTSEEERGKIKQAVVSSLTDLTVTLEDNLTDRLRIDMQSDSWLSKNIRPLSIVFTTVVVTVLACTDGNIDIQNFHFVVKETYVKLMESLMLMQYTFYFGGRSVEKIMQSANQLRMSKVTRKERKQQATNNLDLD